MFPVQKKLKLLIETAVRAILGTCTPRKMRSLKQRHKVKISYKELCFYYTFLFFWCFIYNVHKKLRGLALCGLC